MIHCSLKAVTIKIIPTVPNTNINESSILEKAEILGDPLQNFSNADKVSM
jgi:hypothetical protein